ncbi:M48 family metallopeptidase [Ruminiclostridium herbifermentans]|uniref:M48 family metallopeptidase n=1 Tax=Ruminiclostridium herbifermentans TaxID=2488810 RepID=A0A4U7JBB1_9FIRM|nr:SprT family zinc-dependent metalloprotease [Ruminiclostridium herbifermentans]QNU67835.1 M48 family metallopeptidase [Ruminiclostridium herbifermentans]
MGSDIQKNQKLFNIKVEDTEINYIVTRSNRKTIGITIDKNGLVKVTSPYRVSESYINELMYKKSSWIQKKLLELKSRAEKAKSPKMFYNGESFLYLGNEFELKICRDSSCKKATVKIEGKNIVIDLPINFNTDNIKKILRQWYIEQFKHIAAERINHYSAQIGVFPKKVTIREQKTRWGSCSSKGNINLNWKLIMASLEVLDYVIVHELCHMIAMNHSEEFWKIVGTFSPQYKNYRDWLRHNGESLNFD